MSESKPYRPIACSLYDVLEAAAVRRHPLSITMGGVARVFVVEDLFSRGKEEFLVARLTEDNQRITVRLDKVELIVDPSDKKSYVASHR